MEKLCIILGSHHAGSGIAHADGVRASLDLRLGVAQGDFRSEIQQILHKAGFVEEVGHDSAQPAKLRTKGERAFDPANDGFLIADPTSHDLDGLDAVVHPPTTHRVGHAELPQARGVRQRGLFLVDDGPLVEQPLDAILARDVNHLTRGI